MEHIVMDSPTAFFIPQGSSIAQAWFFPIVLLWFFNIRVYDNVEYYLFLDHQITFFVVPNSAYVTVLQIV